ncbi:MAG TPA: heavy metal translocating P-type ATPase [Vicinamibacterales bacterium]|nr:heavy metal translocating P-type ATPase [Vicinamibacterales bacterium]
MTTDLSVTGMTCAACQANVQRALNRQPGVTDASVNLMTGQARVVFDPAVVQPEQLVAAVESIGYGAAVPSAESSAVMAQGARDEQERAEFTSLRRRAVVAGVIGAAAMATPMRLSMGGTAGAWVLMALTVFVMTWAGGTFYVRGVRALWHRVPDMNSLVAIGTGAAFLYSVVATLRAHVLVAHGVEPAVYYEAVIVIIAFVLAGRTLEARARRQTSEALRALVRLQPTDATVLEGGHERVVNIDQIRAGDVVLVRPGERVAVDGVVTAGTGSLDESMVTGESMPVVRAAGATVTGGTINVAGAIQVRATRVGPDSTLAQIVRLMGDAQASRAPIQQLADRVSAVFVPAVMAIAALTVIVWLLVGGQGVAIRALATGVSVLIIACPCAMGLAVPTAVMVATGRAGTLGVLIKGGEALQRLADVDTVIFDKTGTITEGRPAVASVVACDGDEAALLRRAAAVERLSEHPVADAITRAASANGLPDAATDFVVEPGRGVRGRVAGHAVIIGTAAWIEAHGVDSRPLQEAADERARDGETALFVAEDDRALGVIGIVDPLRAEAADALRHLRDMGLSLVMLTGDRRSTADVVAAAAGIHDVIAEVLPQGKVDAVRDRQQRGRYVAMVGDGINDAPALAQADVGIAMGGGTDLALDAADIALMRGDLHTLVSAIRVSRAAMRIMKQNLFWAFIYNCIGIPIAAGVLYPAFGILLSPVLASAAMALSSVSVVSNSLRLKGAAA